MENIKYPTPLRLREQHELSPATRDFIKDSLPFISPDIPIAEVIKTIAQEAHNNGDDIQTLRDFLRKEFNQALAEIGCEQDPTNIIASSLIKNLRTTIDQAYQALHSQGVDCRGLPIGVIRNDDSELTPIEINLALQYLDSLTGLLKKFLSLCQSDIPVTSFFTKLLKRETLHPKLQGEQTGIWNFVTGSKRSALDRKLFEKWVFSQEILKMLLQYLQNTSMKVLQTIYEDLDIDPVAYLNFCIRHYPQLLIIEEGKLVVDARLYRTLVSKWLDRGVIFEQFFEIFEKKSPVLAVFYHQVSVHSDAAMIPVGVTNGVFTPSKLVDDLKKNMEGIWENIKNIRNSKFTKGKKLYGTRVNV